MKASPMIPMVQAIQARPHEPHRIRVIRPIDQFDSLFMGRPQPTGPRSRVPVGGGRSGAGVGLEDVAERGVVVPEALENRGGEMARVGAAVPRGDDLHGLGMVEGGLVGPLAAQGVVDVADAHDPGILGALLALPVAATIMMLIEELRVDLPGEQELVADTALRARDDLQEEEYERRTEGVGARQAAAIAVEISEDRRYEDQHPDPPA